MLLILFNQKVGAPITPTTTVPPITLRNVYAPTNELRDTYVLTETLRATNAPVETLRGNSGGGTN